MGFISETQKELIRQRVPLEELLPDYNVQLIAAGRQFKALCPFHREKTPSFWVDPDKQLYHCYGCQEGGDLFRFVQAIDGVGWNEAVQLLARRAGVVLEEIRASADGGGLVELFDANRAAADFYHRTLLGDPRAEPARRYLQERRIDPSMWRSFDLGYSLPDWDAFSQHARAKNTAATVLERAGLVRARSGGGGHFDYFRGRLMFPIGDAQGRILGFGARTLSDEEPKYLNTPKTALFDKSKVLYGIQRAKVGIRRSGFVTIVEGYTDVIAAHQAGLDTFVASLGTAFTEENAKQLRRLAPRVHMIFDGDAAGQRALERSLDLLVAEELDVRIYSVTDGKDPCDAVLALGAETFQEKIDRESRGIFEFKWHASVDALGADASATARARGIDECLALVAKVPNAVTRQLVVRQLAERAMVSEREIAARLGEILKRRSKTSPRGSGSGSGSGSGIAADAADAADARDRVDASGGPDAGADRLGELQETVLRCLIEQRESATAMWADVPAELFRTEGEFGCEIEELVSAAIAAGRFSGEELVRRSSNSAVARLVSRLVDIGAAPKSDEDALEMRANWKHCLRDLDRWRARSRLYELDQKIQAARRDDDTERVGALQRERMALRKQSKQRAG